MGHRDHREGRSSHSSWVRVARGVEDSAGFGLDPGAIRTEPEPGSGIGADQHLRRPFRTARRWSGASGRWRLRERRARGRCPLRKGLLNTQITIAQASKFGLINTLETILVEVDEQGGQVVDVVRRRRR